MRPRGALVTLDQALRAIDEDRLYAVAEGQLLAGPGHFIVDKATLYESIVKMPNSWNLNEQSATYPNDFVFSNYWDAHAYSLKMRAKP